MIAFKRPFAACGKITKMLGAFKAVKAGEFNTESAHATHRH